MEEGGQFFGLGFADGALGVEDFGGEAFGGKSFERGFWVRWRASRRVLVAEAKPAL